MASKLAARSCNWGSASATARRSAHSNASRYSPSRSALGILQQIEAAATILISRHQCSAIGIGFGGPLDATHGKIIKSHQIEGWDDFGLADWCQQRLGLSARVHNDCDVAALAEARFGAGRHQKVVFYVTVGTGIGGGLVIDGHIFRGHGAGAAEIGHLRPGLHAEQPDQTVESLASGWGIAAAAQARLSEPLTHQFLPFSSGGGHRPEEVRQRLIEAEEASEEYAADLLERCDGQADRVTAKIVAQAASDGNELAREMLLRAARRWAGESRKTITLIAPDVVVVGGGVTLTEEALFVDPLRKEVETLRLSAAAQHLSHRAGRARRTSGGAGGLGDRVGFQRFVMRRRARLEKTSDTSRSFAGASGLC